MEWQTTIKLTSVDDANESFSMLIEVPGDDGSFSSVGLSADLRTAPTRSFANRDHDSIRLCANQQAAGPSPLIFPPQCSQIWFVFPSGTDSQTIVSNDVQSLDKLLSPAQIIYSRKKICLSENKLESNHANYIILLYYLMLRKSIANPKYTINEWFDSSLRVPRSKIWFCCLSKGHWARSENTCVRWPALMPHTLHSWATTAKKMMIIIIVINVLTHNTMTNKSTESTERIQRPFH